MASPRHLKCSNLAIKFFSAFMVVGSVNLLSPRLKQTISDCIIAKGTAPSQIFDPVSMSCTDCPDGSERDATGMNCVCKAGYRKEAGGKLLCIACGPAQVTSADGWSCVTCPSNNNKENNLCKNCPVQVDRAVNGSQMTNAMCVTCIADTVPSADGSRCERCSSILDSSPSGTSTSPTTCSCNGDKQLVGGFCFSKVDVPDLLSNKVMLTNADKTEESPYLKAYLNIAYLLCKVTESNESACEQLVNLCVANYASLNSEVCLLYLRDNSKSTIKRVQLMTIEDWPPNLPWLYHADNGKAILDSVIVDTRYSFKLDAVESRLKFKVAMFTLNGEYHGLSDVKDGLMQLCTDTQKRLNSAWIFGTFYTQTCELQAMNLLDRTKYETIFFDPYLEYTKSNVVYLYPIPVLIKNYYSNDGEKVNSQSDTAKWQFVRRFFLVDNSMFTDGSGDTTIARYLKSMEIKINVVNGDEGRIHTPYMVLEYSHVLREEVNDNTTVTTSFTVTYEMTDSGFTQDFQIAIGIMSAAGALYAILRTWSWSRRSGAQAFCLTIIKYLLFACGAASNAMLVVLVCVSLWWMVTYKRQDVVFLLPITSDQEVLFRNCLIIALSFKIIDIIHLFVVQCSVDIFLIDWERPKSAANPQAERGEEKRGETPVSIWRTYFVANEWNEIQTARKICPLFQFIVTLFLLEAIGFENLCSKDRASVFTLDSSEYSAPSSPMFRFAVMSVIWICLAIIQWIFFTFIWERFVDDNVRQFVDLCSMANVSVFILENNQFGYYIHGRSPHGLADTGMKEMFLQLKRETESLCAHRGLVPNTDNQTFRMSLPGELRRKFDLVLRPLNAKDNHQVTKTQGQGDSFDAQVAAYKTINKVLSDFIDHSLRDIDYTVRDKMFFESVFECEMEVVTDTKGFFYNDNGHSFDQVLLYGHELALTAFEILLFGFVDAVGNYGFILSALVTYFVGLFLRLVRESLGRKNLAMKTLVDDRFLI